MTRLAAGVVHPGFTTSREPGQATVEFALLLPLVLLVLLAIVQTGLVARDQVMVVHAAREAAREASVDAGIARVLAAVRRVLPDAVVSVDPDAGVGAPRAVEVTYVSRTELPLVGVLYPDPSLTARVVMRAER